MTKKPSLCLIGTSNGVFEDGYVSVFRKSPYLKEFSKNCLGYCSSTLFSMKAPSIDFTAFDLCVLDFAANDGVQIKDGVTTPELVHSTVSDAVRRVLAKGCLPALLILPVLSVFQSKERKVRDVYLDIATRYNLPVFDGYDYLDHLEGKGGDIATLFKDDMHLHEPFAAQLAGLFFEGLLVAHRLKAPGAEISGADFTYNYHAVDTFDTGDSLLAHRKSALFEAEILDVTVSCDLPIPDSAGGEVVAIGVDWANSRGRLTISGATSCTIRITNPYTGDDPKRFVFGLYPTIQPVRLEKSCVKLALTDDGLAPAKLALGGFVIRQMHDYCIRTQLPAPLIISDAYSTSKSAPDLRDARRWGRPLYFFENIEQFLQRKETPSGIYTIKILDIFFDFLVANRQAATTVVSFHAAMPNRKDFKLPIFTGQTLAGAEANVILVSDPGLYANATVPLAWFAGLRGCPVQEILPVILESLNDAFGKARLIFTGASGGGFGALFYGHRFPGSLCVPSNPQTDIAKFDRLAVQYYCVAGFGTKGDLEIQDVLDNQIVSNLCRLYEGGFENFIIYCQNASDIHVEQHEKPFFESLPKEQRSQVALVHGDWGNGHIAPPADLWARMLAEAVNWPGDWADFVATADFSYLGKNETSKYPRHHEPNIAHSPVADSIEAVLFFGQSNAGGPASPKTHLLEARYPDRLFTFGDSQRYGSVEMAEGSNINFRPFKNPFSYLYIQTPTAHFLEHLAEKAGSPPSLRFFHSTWHGGQPIRAFLPDSPAYKTIVNIARDFENVARINGRIGKISALVWLQGEGVSEGYGQALAGLINTLNADLMSIIREQASPPAWLVAQINNKSGNSEFNQVALDQLELSLRMPGVTLVGPMYQLPFISLEDLIHPDERGRLMYGELLALVYHSVVVQKRPFEPLRPLEARLTGNKVMIKFRVPALPLQWDEEWIKPVRDYGFVVEDAGRKVDISAIEITAPDTVEIRLARPIKRGRILYAMGQDESVNGWAGGRGQLMSQTTHKSLFCTEGFAIPEVISHYCVRFALPISDAVVRKKRKRARPDVR